MTKDTTGLASFTEEMIHYFHHLRNSPLMRLQVQCFVQTDEHSEMEPWVVTTTKAQAAVSFAQKAVLLAQVTMKVLSAMTV